MTRVTVNTIDSSVNNTGNAAYEVSIHRMGRIWMSTALLVILAVPFSISLFFNTWPAAGPLMGGLLPIMMIYVPIDIIAVFADPDEQRRAAQYSRHR